MTDQTELQRLANRVQRLESVLILLISFFVGIGLMMFWRVLQ